MDITIEYLKSKRAEYEAGYMEHIALANANHGAMEAIDALIAKAQKPTEDGGGEKPPS